LPSRHRGVAVACDHREVQKLDKWDETYTILWCVSRSNGSECWVPNNILCYIAFPYLTELVNSNNQIQSFIYSKAD